MVEDKKEKDRGREDILERKSHRRRGEERRR